MPGDDQEILEFGLDHYFTKPLRKLAIRSKRSEYRPKEAKLLGPLTLEKLFSFWVRAHKHRFIRCGQVRLIGITAGVKFKD